MYAHMLTFDTYCTVVCVHCSSLTHINTHTHIHTSVYLAAPLLLRGDNSNLAQVCPEQLELIVFALRKEGSNSNTVLPAAQVHTLGCWWQTAFITRPRLLFAGTGARAVDSHLASVAPLFGG